MTDAEEIEEIEELTILRDMDVDDVRIHDADGGEIAPAGWILAITTRDTEYAGEISGVRVVDRGKVELTAINVEDRDGEIVDQEQATEDDS